MIRSKLFKKIKRISDTYVAFLFIVLNLCVVASACKADIDGCHDKSGSIQELQNSTEMQMISLNLIDENSKERESLPYSNKHTICHLGHLCEGLIYKDNFNTNKIVAFRNVTENSIRPMEPNLEPPFQPPKIRMS